MTRPRPAALAVALIALPALVRLGLWTPGSAGFDAVSAVTPGYVAVVGAGTTALEGAPVSPTEADLVRGALYLAGGLHTAIDPDVELVAVRPAHAPLEGRDLAQHLRVVRAVVEVLRDIAPEARIQVLAGGAPGSGVVASPGLLEALDALAGDAEFGGRVQVVRLAAEEVEQIEVPDGGEAADLYPVPVALLECDAVINVARYAGPLSAMRNLEGLAAPAALVAPAGTDETSARWVDQALLMAVDYTLLDLLGRDHPRNPLVLASADGVAVDRLAEALAGRHDTPAALRLAGERQLGMSSLAGIKVTGLSLPGTWVEAQEPLSE